MSPYRNSREHLFAELRRLDLVLNLAVARQRRDPVLAGFSEFRGLFISEDEINQLLAGAAARSEELAPPDDAGTRKLQEAVEQTGRQIAALVEEASESGVHLALRNLARLFCLSAFDVDALLVCVAPELNVKYGKLYAYLQNDVTRKRPSADLILNLFCRSLEEKLDARSRLLGDAPLVRHGLVRYAVEDRDGPTTMLTRTLHVDERILNYLLDVESPDAHLAPFVSVVRPVADLQELLLPDVTAQALARLFRALAAAPADAGGRRPLRALFFHGPSGAGKEFAAEALCRAAGRDLLVADLAALAASGANLDDLLRRLFREARLRSAAVYLDGAESVLGEGERESAHASSLLTALGEFAGVAFVGTRQPWHAGEGASAEQFFFHVAFPVPDYDARLQLWRRLLGEEGGAVADDIETEALADKFSFTAGRIRGAIVEARQRAMLRDAEGQRISTADLYHACRAQSSKKLSTLARKITPLYTWGDIILPADQLEHLREVCAQVKHRQRVFAEWGFARKI